MKLTNKLKPLLFILLFAFSLNAFCQDTYNYTEVIVLQKVAKSKSDVKEMYVNSSTDDSINKDDIAKIITNAELLKYMKDNNWEFVERLGSQPSNSGPIWISYIFRKK